MKSPLSYQARRELIEHMAPQYHEASGAQKILLLDTFVTLTSYVRKYAMWLLNHPVESRPSMPHARPVHYGPEVQQALLFARKAANQICAKRLIPFLSTLVETLERHGHLYLTEEHRNQLLSMSVATADRLPRSQRKAGLRGISTTRAGTLLKHQIPIRTFQDWDETQPGFLEADLVPHCGIQADGGYLYTLTLTDIAPGGGLRDTHDTKARAQRRLLISIVAVADRDLGLPALVTFYVSEYGSLTPYIVLLYS